VVSAGQIDIRPESLSAAGSSLAQTGAQMADAVTGLQAAVTGSGNPWGGDEAGTMFSAVYAVVLGNALDALGSYVEQVGYAAVALSRQAREVAAADENAAGQITSAGSGL
jgi:uncharacterized protein YukE